MDDAKKKLVAYLLFVLHVCCITISFGLFMQEIVALSGAHTLGRSRPDRSGWGKPETKYTVCFLVHFGNSTGKISYFQQ